MNRRLVIAGIILIGLATIAMGLQTHAIGTVMSLKAYKGPQITDLYIIYADETLSMADRVKVTAYYTNGTRKYSNIYNNILIINGVSIIPLTNLNQNDTILVEVAIGNGKSKQDMSGQTIVKLRPDLTIQNINAPSTAFNTSYFNVNINVIELNNDAGANYTLLIKEGNSVMASKSSYISAGGTATISVPILINHVGLHSLSAVITDSDPAEYSTDNNQRGFSIEIIRPLQEPDLTVQSINAPASALPTSYFNVDVNVAELNMDTGAAYTLFIKENDIVLASSQSSVPAGGNVTVPFSLLINKTGTHTLSAIIQDSNPAEDDIANNRQDFTVEMIRPLISPADYTMWYYSQGDNYNNNKNLNSAAGGGTHIEVSQYIERKISERFYFKLTINKELIFPIDSLRIQLSNESGIMEEHENITVIPTKIEKGRPIASIFYPDTGTTLTITSISGLTEVKLEKRAIYQEILSSGYNYYSPSENRTWNSSLINQTGTLLKSRIKTGIYIEVIDDGSGYGGVGTMNLTLPVYFNSTWNDAGISGYRDIATYYTKQAGRT